MTVIISGLPSVLNRTIFTDNGPIVKPALPILSGSNLYTASPNTVSISTGSFNSTFIGKQVKITGSVGGRNDGTFPINEVLGPTLLQVSGASFDPINVVATTALIVNLANNIKLEFNQHRTQPGIHLNPDTFNPVVASDAVDLSTALVLLDSLRDKLSAHVVQVLPGPIHIEADFTDVPQLPAANDLASAILAVNELRDLYEAHRLNEFVHVAKDSIDYMSEPSVVAPFGGPSYGPLSWTILDPRIGQIANDPSDVSVTVNSVAASVDAVFGLLGAIVLTTKPTHGSTVSVNYDWMRDPPTQMLRLTTEFSLNQTMTGLPGHQYRARSFLAKPSNSLPDIAAPVEPQITGWKYKLLDRPYSAVLNDPNTLLLNVPSNKVIYPVYDKTFGEVLVRFDPTSLPDKSMDPWTVTGTGVAVIPPGVSELVLTGSPGNPVFYSYPIDLSDPSLISAAFRMYAELGTPDGVFAGPGFGLSNGARIGFAGLLQTPVNNLSSAIYQINVFRAAFANHLVQIGVHEPYDTLDTPDIVPASDLQSLVILANRLETLYSQHISHGPNHIHENPDTINTVTDAPATNLNTAIQLVNDLVTAFNHHLVYPSVHYNNDVVNSVGTVRQVGLLTNPFYPELATSWVSSAFDWTQYTSFRMSWNQYGNISIYAGGSTTPLASVGSGQLPATSDVDLDLGVAQQVFFGDLSRQASSKSHWAFIRTDIIPTDYTLTVGNKYVDYIPATVPEQDPLAPWITIGEGGIDRIIGSGMSSQLVVDSTESATPVEAQSLGLTTGTYRGFLRFEPSLTDRATCSIEFQTNIGYYTFSVDNRAAGVFLDDGDLSVHMVFLQETPSPATTTGTHSEPFPIVANDSAVLSIDGGLPITITFTSPITTAVDVCTVINHYVGFNLASPTSDHRVELTDSISGVASSIQLINGNAFTKLGLNVGTYFGLDSNPEPRVSWFGANYPNDLVPAWSTSGTQSVQLLGRILRITDVSTSDYLVYTQSDPLYTSTAIPYQKDWKLDARLTVQSYTPGVVLASGPDLYPCGAIVNVDEGVNGKNLELQLSTDSIGNGWVAIVSYDSPSGSLVAIAQFPFKWNDQKQHVYNVYTSKLSGLCLVLADNTLLGTFSYSSLNVGSSAGPSITFGSGGTAVANCDLTTPQSVVDWQSVCIFRDLKVSDPTAVGRRFIGLYQGGNPAVLTSYFLHQIDWTLPHTYRIVRNPSGLVSVHVDGGAVPVISVNYNSLNLLPSASSFFYPITQGRSVVAFGSFNPFEIERTIWNRISYSIGIVTNTDTTVPQHNVLNQVNTIVSPDHLYSPIEHGLYGTSVYSGGTPTDDFLSDPDEPAIINLFENTPPYPMTQDLDSRGGLAKRATKIESISSVNVVDSSGFLADFDDDTTNVPSVTPAQVTIQSLTNDLLSNFNQHLTAIVISGSTKVQVHQNNDTINTILTSPATTFSAALTLLNQIESSYNSHLTQATVHYESGVIDFESAPIATDTDTAITLLTDLIGKFDTHIFRVKPHPVQDTADAFIPVNAPDLFTLIDASNEIKSAFNNHVTSAVYHLFADPSDVITAPNATDLPSMITLLTSIVSKYNIHIASGVFHSSPDLVNNDGIAPPVDLATCSTQVLTLGTLFNAHLVSLGIHTIADSPDYITPVSIGSALSNSIAVLTDLQSKYNAHLTQYNVHITNDEQNTSVLPPPVDLPSSINVANDLKSKYTVHLTSSVGDAQSQVHTTNDSVNIISSPAATNLPSLVALTTELWNKFNSHRVQPTVHGSSVIISLVAPTGVIYSGAEFFENVTGIPGLLSAFADDEELSGTMTSALSGTAASVTVASGVVTISGLTGIDNINNSQVGRDILLSGAAFSANNGSFLVLTCPSSTSVTIANPSAVSGDANNTHIVWSIEPQSITIY